jgi:hypothetical protein
VDQTQIEKPAVILDEMGFPTNLGWARKPVFLYNASLDWTPQRFLTASDKYIIFSKSFMFIFEIYDGGFLGYTTVTAVSLIDKHISTKTIVVSCPLGDLNNTSISEKDSIRYRHKKTLLDFIVMEHNSRIIKIDMPQIGHNRNLRGEVVLIEPPNAESIYTNSIYRSESKRFQFLRCSPWWSVEGVMQFENIEMAFNKNKAWGIFYWHRSARPKVDVHYWAAGCGLLSDGRQISFNTGYGSVDSFSGTENGFFINGILNKLELVTFKVSAEGWLKPWKFTSNDFRLEMSFYPVQKCYKKNYMLNQSTRVQQAYGFFSGKVKLDDGNEVYFEKITGIVERKKTCN